jgi:hypothetical protein
MFEGEHFKAAWSSATSAAKSAAAAIATGTRKLVGVAHEALLKAVGGTEAAAHATSEAVQWAEKQTVAAAKWSERNVVTAARASADVVNAAYDAVKKQFTDVVAGTIRVACSAENAFVKEGATGAAWVLANRQLKPLQDVLLGEQPIGLPHDGEMVGAGCKAKGSNSGGALPNCPKGRIRILGKATYINGIQTDYPTGERNAGEVNGICKTMQKLANATCAEIVGVYNATGGMRADIGECLTNIAKDSDSPAVDTLQRSMLDGLSHDPPQDMTIFAHSQGGLMTQEALAVVKNQLTIEYGEAGAVERMQHLSIKSFGTAEQGWPAGPNYEQFTNDSDPIPGVIAGAQKNYPDATFADNADIPATQRHHFDSPHLNPVDSHSMDNVYIKQMVEIHGQPNCCY